AISDGEIVEKCCRGTALRDRVSAGCAGMLFDHGLIRQEERLVQVIGRGGPPNAVGYSARVVDIVQRELRKKRLRRQRLLQRANAKVEAAQAIEIGRTDHAA